ncbi:MAG TPA: hypothetical protein VF283_13050 [Bryobacteraceae bacterium]
MYSHLEREAKEAGLVLNWPSRLPNTRHALAAAEWVRRHQPEKFARFQKALFAAHFVSGEDLGNTAIVEGHASELESILTVFMPLGWMGPLLPRSANPRRWAANAAYAARPPGSSDGT